MQAVVLAAGEGTRLGPLTADRPKPLVEVAGKPLLTHCLEAIAPLDVSGAVVVVGYRGEDIVDHYGDAFGDLPIAYARQPERKGLAHALLMAEPAVEDDAVLVTNGDNVFGGDLSALEALHRSNDAAIAFLTQTVTDEEASGGAVCGLDDDGSVASLVEKPDDPPSNLIPAGCYVLPREVFHACRLVRPSDRGEYELPDAIDLLLHAGYPAATRPLDDWRINVNTPGDVERAEQRLRAGGGGYDSE